MVRIAKRREHFTVVHAEEQYQRSVSERRRCALPVHCGDRKQPAGVRNRSLGGRTIPSRTGNVAVEDAPAANFAEHREQLLIRHRHHPARSSRPGGTELPDPLCDERFHLRFELGSCERFHGQPDTLTTWGLEEVDQ